MKKTALWLVGGLLVGVLAGCSPEKPAEDSSAAQVEEMLNRAAVHVYITTPVSAGDTSISTERALLETELNEYIALSQADGVWDAVWAQYPDIEKAEITVTGIENTRFLRVTYKSAARSPEECTAVVELFADTYCELLKEAYAGELRALVVSAPQ